MARMAKLCLPNVSRRANTSPSKNWKTYSATPALITIKFIFVAHIAILELFLQMLESRYKSALDALAAKSRRAAKSLQLQRILPPIESLLITLLFNVICDLHWFALCHL